MSILLVLNDKYQSHLEIVFTLRDSDY